MKTFKVDNRFIQNVPSTFGSRRPKLGSDQLYLPGLEPFGPFDLWATFALFSLLDQERPEEVVRTTPTELLEILEFAKVVSDALAGYETFKSKHYRMVEEALHRLYTVQVNWRGYYNVMTGKRGRPEKRYVDYNDRILVRVGYIYPEGVTPPEQERPTKRKNVNKAMTTTGEPGPPIYKLTSGPKPEFVEFRFAPDLVKGLQGEMIGSTTIPLQFFNLRAKFQPYPLATRLLVWTLRQTARRMTRDIDRLINELNFKGVDATRNRRQLLDFFAMLQEVGVVESVHFDPTTNKVTFKKGEAWHFPRGRKTPIEEGDHGDEDGEEVDDEGVEEGED